MITVGGEKVYIALGLILPVGCRNSLPKCPPVRLRRQALKSGKWSRDEVRLPKLCNTFLVLLARAASPPSRVVEVE